MKMLKLDKSWSSRRLMKKFPQKARSNQRCPTYPNKLMLTVRLIGGLVAVSGRQKSVRTTDNIAVVRELRTTKLCVLFYMAPSIVVTIYSLYDCLYVQLINFYPGILAAVALCTPICSYVLFCCILY